MTQPEQIQPEQPQTFPQPSAQVAAANPEPTIAGLTKSQFEAKNSEHGGRLKILGVPLDGEEFDVILRPMTRHEYSKLQQQMVQARQRGDNMDTIQGNAVRGCVVAPSVEIYNAQLELYPALTGILIEKLMDMAGAESEVREKTFQ